MHDLKPKRPGEVPVYYPDYLQLNKILTPEQIARHEAMQKERAAVAGEKRREHKPQQERAAPIKPSRQ